MKTYTQDCLFSNSFFVHLKSNKNNCKKPAKISPAGKKFGILFLQKNKEVLLWTTKKKQ